MKLTIENYWHLERYRLPNMCVESVDETDYFYIFECSVGNQTYKISLCRESESELNGKPVFYFRDGSHNTQGVTADTLKDINDVLSILEEELQNQIY